MTRLTDTQQEKLTRVQNENAEFKRVEAQLRETFEAQVDEARGFLIRAIQEAIEVGVPKRRIHIDGLGTKDSKTLNDLLAEYGVKQPEKPAQRGTGIREVQDGTWLATARDGRTFEFFVVDLGDMIVIDSSGNTEEGAATFGVRPPADVFAMLERQFPKADLSEFLDDDDYEEDNG